MRKRLSWVYVLVLVMIVSACGDDGKISTPTGPSTTSTSTSPTPPPPSNPADPPPNPPGSSFPTPGRGNTDAAELCKYSKNGVHCQVQTYVRGVSASALFWNTSSVPVKGNLASYGVFSAAPWDQKLIDPAKYHAQALLQPGAKEVLLSISLMPCRSQEDAWTGERIDNPPHPTDVLIGYAGNHQDGFCQPPSSPPPPTPPPTDGCPASVNATLTHDPVPNSNPFRARLVPRWTGSYSAVLQIRRPDNTSAEPMNLTAPGPTNELTFPIPGSYLFILTITGTRCSMTHRLDVPVLPPPPPPPPVPVCADFNPSLTQVSFSETDTTYTVIVRVGWLGTSSMSFIGWGDGSMTPTPQPGEYTKEFAKGAPGTAPIERNIRFSMDPDISGPACTKDLTIKVPPRQTPPPPIPTCPADVRPQLAQVSVILSLTTATLEVSGSWLGSGNGSINWGDSSTSTPMNLPGNRSHLYTRGTVRVVYTVTLTVQSQGLSCPIYLPFEVLPREVPPPPPPTCDEKFPPKVTLTSDTLIEFPNKSGVEVTVIYTYQNKAGSFVGIWRESGGTSRMEEHAELGGKCQDGEQQGKLRFSSPKSEHLPTNGAIYYFVEFTGSATNPVFVQKIRIQ